MGILIIVVVAIVVIAGVGAGIYVVIFRAKHKKTVLSNSQVNNAVPGYNADAGMMPGQPEPMQDLSQNLNNSFVQEQAAPQSGAVMNDIVHASPVPQRSVIPEVSAFQQNHPDNALNSLDGMDQGAAIPNMADMGQQSSDVQSSDSFTPMAESTPEVASSPQDSGMANTIFTPPAAETEQPAIADMGLGDSYTTSAPSQEPYTASQPEMSASDVASNEVSSPEISTAPSANNVPDFAVPVTTEEDNAPQPMSTPADISASFAQPVQSAPADNQVFPSASQMEASASVPNQTQSQAPEMASATDQNGVANSNEMHI